MAILFWIFTFTLFFTASLPCCCVGAFFLLQAFYLEVSSASDFPYFPPVHKAPSRGLFQAAWSWVIFFQPTLAMTTEAGAFGLHLVAPLPLGSFRWLI